MSDLILTLTKQRPLYVHVSLPENFVCASRQNCNFMCQFELIVNLRIDCFLSCAYWVRLDINVLAVPYLAAKQLVSYNSLHVLPQCLAVPGRTWSRETASATSAWWTTTRTWWDRPRAGRVRPASTRAARAPSAFISARERWIATSTQH